MRILAIRGMNLASIEGEFEIDFTKEPLQSAGIFAITGKTGSGKSTILDAMTLALYAKTARYIDLKSNIIAKESSQNILRKGTGEAYAEIDFENAQGERYRSRWSIQRAHKRIDGNIQNYEMLLTDLDGQVIASGRVNEVLQEIEARVGLSFEQFTRTVLLAQGDFAAFLKADTTKKTELLERVMGTEIFRQISMAIHEKNREIAKQLSDLQSQINEYKLLDDTEVTALNLQIAETEQQKKDLESELKEAEAILRWLDQEQKLKQSLELATTEYKAALQKREETAEARKLLNKILSIEPLRSSYSMIKRLEKELQNAIKSEGKQTQELHRTKELLKTKQTETEGYIQARNKAEEAQKRAKPLIRQAQELDQKITAGSEKLKSIQKQLEAKSAEQLQKAEEELDSQRSKQNRLQEKSAQLAQTLSLEIARLREQLTEGQPCAVCGSTHHPYAGEHQPALEEETLLFERVRIAREITQTATQIEQSLEQIGRLKELANTEASLAIDLQQLTQEVTQDQSARKMLLEGRDTDEVERDLEQALKQSTAALEHSRESVSKLEGDLRAVEAKLGLLNSQIEERQQDITEYTQELDRLLKERDDGMQVTELRTLLEYNKEWITDEQKRFKVIDERLKETEVTKSERQRLLEQHENEPNKPKNSMNSEELNQLIQTKSATLETLSSQLIELASELKRNDKLKLELQEKLEQLKAFAPKAQNWAKLNEVYGSHDGKRLATFAQAYTIKHLLAYANHHLSEIAPRYRLHQLEDNALDLVIIDLEMLSSQRPVHSLSGGETFLVSLALALGLSSLSSDHLSIKSLFIDEGFGSLDSDTLSIALDALENLQSEQGRKVGVISHVAEMNERLSVKIQLLPRTSGSSQLRITP